MDQKDLAQVQQFYDERCDQIVYRYCFSNLYLRSMKGKKKMDANEKQELGYQFETCLIKNKVFMSEAQESLNEDDFQKNF